MIQTDGLIDIAREFLTKVTGELDPYTSEKGKINVENDKVILLTPSHIQFAKYGRGPGKRPPLDPILAWVQREGIIFNDKTVKGTAFAIQKSIGENGTLNWVQNAPNAIDDAVFRWFDEYNRKSGHILAIQIAKEVELTMGNVTSAGSFNNLKL